MQNASDESIGSLYETLKDHLMVQDYQGAKKALKLVDFPTIWKQLFEHAMFKHNCHVTKFVIKELANAKICTKEEVQREVSAIHHRVQIDFCFSKRLTDYLANPDFDEGHKQYTDTLLAAATSVRGRFGVPLLAPKDL